MNMTQKIKQNLPYGENHHTNPKSNYSLKPASNETSQFKMLPPPPNPIESNDPENFRENFESRIPSISLNTSQYNSQCPTPSTADTTPVFEHLHMDFLNFNPIPQIPYSPYSGAPRAYISQSQPEPCIYEKGQYIESHQPWFPPPESYGESFSFQHRTQFQNQNITDVYDPQEFNQEFYH
eukprot:NODE_19_length_47148_cov_1.447810.p33 type:complete len:180 gc:universal NODE_19_length_47148_cov_1.447810:6895-6356(-)